MEGRGNFVATRSGNNVTAVFSNHTAAKLPGDEVRQRGNGVRYWGRPGRSGASAQSLHFLIK